MLDVEEILLSYFVMFLGHFVGWDSADFRFPVCKCTKQRDAKVG